MRTLSYHSIPLLVLLLLLSALGADAQNLINNYQVNVYVKKKGENNAITFNYADFFKLTEAEDCYKDMKKRIKEGTEEQVRNKYHFTFEGSGVCNFESRTGGGTVIYNADEDILYLLKRSDGNVKGLSGRTANDQPVTVNCQKGNDGVYVYEVIVTGTQEIGDVEKLGKYKGGGNRRRAFDFEDGWEHFEYHLELPSGYHEENSRIILIPYAVDCMTGDTVDYVTPVVYEGAKYHELQDRRKDFDYKQKDPLGRDKSIKKMHEKRDTIHLQPRMVVKARTDEQGKTIWDETRNDAIRDTVWVEEDSIAVQQWEEVEHVSSYAGSIAELERDPDRNCIILNTTIDWRKPNKKNRYHGELLYAMEDYHRQYFEGHDPGTCLRISPYKFLQMRTAMKDLPLTTEFYETAKESTQDAQRDDLGMQFTHNSADLIEDSLYHVTLDEIRSDMQDIINNDGEVVSAKLVAYASPDGSEKRNNELSGQRAQTALSKIRQILPNNVKVDASHIIDSWENTAFRLEDAGYPEEARQVRELSEGITSTEEAYKIIRQKCPTYMDVIKPILETQCRISFSYKFYSKKVLSAKEAVQAYYTNKHKVYSNGDYYNMFAGIKDSVELDTLTEIAYERVIKKNRAFDKPIAPYLINRMAMLQMRRGRPDSTILKQLITERYRPFKLNHFTLDKSKSPVQLKYNRPELVLNQAVILYQMQEEGRALDFVDYLRENGYKSPELESLMSYINFKKLYQMNQRTVKEENDFQNALAFIENSSPDNRAVLYTEFEDLHKQSEAWKWVHLMDDDNPRKWYLMALLWATRDGQESNYPLKKAVTVKQNNMKLLDEDEEYNLMEKDRAQYDKYLQWKKDTLEKNPNAKPEPKAVVVKEADADVNIDGIPYYMAYFQKCFDMDDEKQSFMKHYFNEGQISEEMREKKNHAYKKDRIPAYRKVFRLRKVFDDEEKAKYKKEVTKGISNTQPKSLTENTPAPPSEKNDATPNE